MSSFAKWETFDYVFIKSHKYFAICCRLLPPQFADHISAPRISITGKNLPPARVVSRTIHTDEGYHDHAGTMMTVAWGQFMDHDFTLMGTPLGKD